MEWILGGCAVLLWMILAAVQSCTAQLKTMIGIMENQHELNRNFREGITYELDQLRADVAAVRAVVDDYEREYLKPLRASRN